MSHACKYLIVGSTTTSHTLITCSTMSIFRQMDTNNDYEVHVCLRKSNGFANNRVPILHEICRPSVESHAWLLFQASTVDASYLYLHLSFAWLAPRARRAEGSHPQGLSNLSRPFTFGVLLRRALRVGAFLEREVELPKSHHWDLCIHANSHAFIVSHHATP